jgi:hypothetical protein
MVFMGEWGIRPHESRVVLWMGWDFALRISGVGFRIDGLLSTVPCGNPGFSIPNHWRRVVGAKNFSPLHLPTLENYVDFLNLAFISKSV